VLQGGDVMQCCCQCVTVSFTNSASSHTCPLPVFQGYDATWLESVLLTGVFFFPVLYINVYLFYFILYCKMLAPSGMKSKRGLASVLKRCHQDSLSILLKKKKNKVSRCSFNESIFK